MSPTHSHLYLHMAAWCSSFSRWCVWIIPSVVHHVVQYCTAYKILYTDCTIVFCTSGHKCQSSQRYVPIHIVGSEYYISLLIQVNMFLLISLIISNVVENTLSYSGEIIIDFWKIKNYSKYIVNYVKRMNNNLIYFIKMKH